MKRQRLALYRLFFAGLTNLLLDYIFILGLGWGLDGAALATGLGYVVGALIPLFYLFWKKE